MQHHAGESRVDVSRSSGSSGAARAALACGIVALVLVAVPIVGAIAVVLGVVVLVLGLVALRRARRVGGGRRDVAGVAVGVAVVALVAGAANPVVWAGLVFPAQRTVEVTFEVETTLDEVSVGATLYGFTPSGAGTSLSIVPELPVATWTATETVTGIRSVETGPVAVDYGVVADLRVSRPVYVEGDPGDLTCRILVDGRTVVEITDPDVADCNWSMRTVAPI